MLTTTPISAQQGASYYTSDNYYSKAETQVYSQWFGRGAARLDLAGQVEGQVFQRLLNGYSPEGDPLTGRKVDPKTHRAGLDLTFSAPKSVSLAALVGGHDDLEQAHRRAVERTLSMIEDQYAQGRVWNPTTKSQEKVTTGNLVMGLFHHDTSRARDPQLHTHCVVMNTTQLENGQWRSLSNEGIVRQTKLFGTIYRNELAFEVQQLGYEIEPRKDGLFELKGYTQTQLDWFSKRRYQIIDLVGEDASSAAKKRAAVLTRAVKGKAVSRDDLRQYWNAQIQEQQLQLHHPVPTATDDDVNESMNDVIQGRAQTALAQAIAHCSERGVAFNRRDLDRFIFTEVQGFRYGDLDAAIDGSAELQKTDDGRWTTQRAIARERYTILLMRQGQGTAEAIASGAEVDQFLSETGGSFTPEQADAIRLTATSTDQVMAWQGVAGAGKSYALAALRGLAEQKGYTVKGYAPSASAAQVLGEEAGLSEATTVARLLRSPPAQSAAEKQLWIVDESGLLSAQAAEELLERAQDEKARVILVGDSRQLSAVEAGNPFKSLQQAGMETAHLTQSRRQRTQVLKEAVEQVAKRSIASIDAGLDLLDQHHFIQQIPESRQRLDKLTQDYLALDEGEREKTLILAGTNAERLALTDLLRQRLRSEGRLEGQTTVTQLRTKDLTQMQASFSHQYQVGDVVLALQTKKGLKRNQTYQVEAIEGKKLVLRGEAQQSIAVDPMAFRKTVYEQRQMDLAVGDRLRWTRNDKAHQRTNGQSFLVTSLNGDQIGITYANNRTETIDRRKMQFLDYGLVSTVYAAQGKTSDRVLIAADHTVSKEGFYVSLSRAKSSLTIYVEDTEALRKRARRSRAKENPSELITTEPVITAEQRQRAEAISPLLQGLARLMEQKLIGKEREGRQVYQGDRYRMSMEADQVMSLEALDSRGELCRFKGRSEGSLELLRARELTEEDVAHISRLEAVLGRVQRQNPEPEIPSLQAETIARIAWSLWSAIRESEHVVQSDPNTVSYVGQRYRMDYEQIEERLTVLAQMGQRKLLELGQSETEEASPHVLFEGEITQADLESWREFERLLQSSQKQREAESQDFELE